MPSMQGEVQIKEPKKTQEERLRGEKRHTIRVCTYKYLVE